jgi:hypothetical protein
MAYQVGLSGCAISLLIPCTTNGHRSDSLDLLKPKFGVHVVIYIMLWDTLVPCPPRFKVRSHPIWACCPTLGPKDMLPTTHMLLLSLPSLETLYLDFRTCLAIFWENLVHNFYSIAPNGVLECQIEHLSKIYTSLE